MTIQRRYSLPNCSLLLEGLGDLGSTNQSFRPPMSILVNAECQIPRLSQPISGGRQFLESLIASVSSYTQELLSGISRPSTEGELTLVRLQKGKSSDSHLLSVYPEPEEGKQLVDTSPIQQVELTTVELFDVLEAIDQLLADTSTLPDLSLNLKPVSRRYAATHNSVNKRFKPIALGLTGLAIAGISSYLLPVPKVEKPKPTPVTNATASPAPVVSPPVATSIPPQAEITDVKVIESLTRQTNTKLGTTWNNKSKIKEDLVYEINVDEKGQIINYSGVNQVATSSANVTPLPNLVPKTAPPAGVRVAKLKAIFKPDGKVEVSRWNP